LRLLNVHALEHERKCVDMMAQKESTHTHFNCNDMVLGKNDMIVDWKALESTEPQFFMCASFAQGRNVRSINFAPGLFLPFVWLTKQEDKPHSLWH